MTVQQYIHVDSSYRNRLLYPNPTDFVVPYVTPNGMGIQTYTNPVSKFMPLYNFVFPECSLSTSIDFFDTGTVVSNSSVQLTITGGNSTEIVFDPDDVRVFLGTDIPSTPNPSSMSGWFFVYGTAAPYQSSEILVFNPSAFSITLSTGITLDLASLSYGYIYNNSTPSKIRINGDLRNVLAYNTTELYLLNTSTDEVRPATLTQTRTLELTTPFTSSGWSVNAFYMLFRYQHPVLHKLVPFPSGGYYTNSARSLKYSVPSNTLASSPLGSVYELLFKDTMTPSGVKIKFVRPLSSHQFGYYPCFEMVAYGLGVNTGDTLVTPDGVHVFIVTSSYQVFKVDGRLTASYKNTFFTPFLFTPMFSNPQDFNHYEIAYNVFPLTFRDYNEPPANYQLLQNQTGSAIVYNVQFLDTENKSLVFINAYEGDVLSRLDNTSGYPTDMWKNCLFSFNSADQYNPLNYNGTTVSSDESVCYRIQLVNLIMPNTFLNSLKVLTSFYPYFLIEFSNLSMSYQNTNSLFTNNPNAQRALFPIPISDVSSPLISQFLNLGCPCDQTIKFKPNDSFRIRIFFPNGESIVPFDKDTLLPYEPDPLLQISAVFSIERL